MSLTYFAMVDGGALVELDNEIALDLYMVAGKQHAEDHRHDDESDCEFEQRNTAKAKELLRTGEKKYIDDNTYIFGQELSEKDRFELILRYGTQTREEFAKEWLSK